MTTAGKKSTTARATVRTTKPESNMPISRVSTAAGQKVERLFFFQAEDGIRDKLVTGVQTCALPIYGARAAHRAALRAGRTARPGADGRRQRFAHLVLLPQPEGHREAGRHLQEGDRRDGDRKSVV